MGSLPPAPFCSFDAWPSCLWTVSCVRSPAAPQSGTDALGKMWWPRSHRRVVASGFDALAMRRLILSATPHYGAVLTNGLQVYSFVPIPGAQQHKRPRRRYEEIERMYKCGWNGCEKAYGTLNHLNAHVTMQSHGQKRTPEGKSCSCATLRKRGNARARRIRLSTILSTQLVNAESAATSVALFMSCSVARSVRVLACEVG